MNWIVFEDEHLLAVNKPAGWNTHSPGPYAGEGLYEWLRNRERRWSGLSILHRLDKETSGLILFGKSAAANRSLSRQFEDRRVHKTYVLLTDRKVTSANCAPGPRWSAPGTNMSAARPRRNAGGGNAVSTGRGSGSRPFR